MGGAPPRRLPRLILRSEYSTSTAWTPVAVSSCNENFSAGRLQLSSLIFRRAWWALRQCATGHHSARLIGASGHEVRLIPSSYVKIYVRRSKTDAADAQAIGEAVGRPSMRFVPVKSAAQKAALLHHRVRDPLVRQRTMLINALSGHLGEFGIIAPAGRHRVVDLINLLRDAGDADVPVLAREALRGLICLRAIERSSASSFSCTVGAVHI